MALSTATVTMDLSDLLGVDFDARRTKVWISTNVPNDTVIDTADNKIRLGSGNVTVSTDGTASLVVWTPGAGANPASWQTYIHVDYPDRQAHGGRGKRTFGPFTITASADLADLVDEQEVPPEYVTTLTAELDGYVTDAAASAAVAQSAADLASAITGLDNADDAITVLDANPASDFRVQQDARLSATIDSTRTATLPPTGATGYLDAALPLRDTAPVVIGIAGCSHSLGSSASLEDAEYASRVSFALRQAYPSLNDPVIPTMRTLSQGTAALPLVPGLHVVNAAVGSTTAQTFLTDATSNELMALKPSFIIMDGGFSNSYANGVTPATAKGHLLARIAYLKSVATAPFGILLLHWFDRQTGTPVASWDAFGQAMREIALADPDTCVFLDLANIGRLADSAGSDDFSIMAPDGTHTNNHGQEIAGNVIAANVLRLSRPPVTVPTTLIRHTRRLTSDTFVGDSTNLTGRITDAALGGTAATVECSGTTAMKTLGGVLTRATDGSSQTYCVPTPNDPDVRVSIDVDDITGGPFYLFARRLSTSGTSAWAYEVTISFDIVGGTKGMAALSKRVNGISSTLAAPVRFTKGDRISLQCVGDRIGLLINGKLAAEAIDSSYPGGNYAGVGTYGNAVFTLDDLAIDVVALSHPVRGYGKTRYTSDAFTGGDASTLHARNSDATLGGTAQPWVTVAASTTHIGIVSGRLARGTSGTPVAYINGASANSEVSMRFVMAAPAEDGSIFLFNRRTGGSSSSASQYRVNVLGAKARLERTAASATGLPLSDWVNLSAGDRVGLACVGPNIDLTVNGNVVASAVDSNVTAAGFAGMEIQGAVTTFSLDDVVIDNLTA